MSPDPYYDSFSHAYSRGGRSRVPPSRPVYPPPPPPFSGDPSASQPSHGQGKGNPPPPSQPHTPPDFIFNNQEWRRRIFEQIQRNELFIWRILGIAIGLFMFFLPAGVGAALHFFDIFGRGIDPNLTLTSSFFWLFFNDFVVREVVIVTILSAGLLFIMLATHDEPLLYPIFLLIGLLFVSVSAIFSLMVSSRCIADLSCDTSAYLLSIALILFSGFVGSALPAVYRLGASILYSAVFLITFAYCSALWLVKLAGTPPYLTASPDIIQATFLLFMNFGLIFLPALLGWQPLMEQMNARRSNAQLESG
ncbi:hypothetical protein [Anaerolinea sp.]|uniref:hypothetical protein n=1 Tax=Anaerolinea sp. TaxID=1872519 RepID=UPI002ACECA6D|nr:hypothetical protein [Anaerolinea sp.]